MNGEKVWGIINETWPVVMEIYRKAKDSYPSLVFHEAKKAEFSEFFRISYQNVMEKFMTEETVTLDSHKQAALLVICFLKLKIIEHPLDRNDKVSIVPQMIAVNMGLSYMLRCLNDTLRERGITKKIERYYMPVATACDTPYPEILCRILYQEQNEQDMDFNVLELSDRFFLLEYINLLQHGIEPGLLKEK